MTKCTICHKPIKPAKNARVYHMACLEKVIPKWYSIKMMLLKHPHLRPEIEVLKRKMEKANSEEERNAIGIEINRYVAMT